MNTRRKLVIALGVGALAAPVASFAQQQGKIWRVGYLSSNSGISPNDEALRLRLREFGYVEGQNLIFEWRFTKGNADLFPKLAAELVRLKVDCIITNGTNATLAAKKETSTIPIIMGNAQDDPVRHGLVASLARPGGNVTGFISISSELAGKRLELLRKTVRKASRVAILWDPNSRPAAAHVEETTVAARALGVQLQPLEVRDFEALENAFRIAGKGHVEALIVVSAGLILSLRARIIEFAVKTRLPVMYADSRWVLDGGLMSYGVDTAEQYRNAAVYVDKILKGAKPADLPVVQPTKFEVVVNMRTAKTLGINLPNSILLQATKVIE